MFKTIIADEADRLGNPFSKTTKAIKQLRSEKRIAMTGTPIQNTPEDLWSISDWLYPRYLGTFTQFQKKYCKLHPTWGRVIGYQNLGQLRERIEPIMLRRLKEDVLKDFPAKTVEYIHFELSKEEREVYDAVRKTVIEEIKKMTDLDTRSLALIPVKMLRLRQATNHMKLIDAKAAENISSSKVGVLKDLLIPVAKSGEKMIVFTEFAEMAHILKEELSEYNPSVIWGGIDALERKNIVDQFTADSDMRVLIMTSAGTYGLNLQVASYVCHFDSPWSVSKLEQREGRAHRIGQDKPVTAYHLIAKNTIDEHVIRILSGKRKMSDEILGDGEFEKLTMGDIEEMLGEEDVS